jgi:hypothetical protein
MQYTTLPLEYAVGYVKGVYGLKGDLLDAEHPLFKQLINY